MSPNVDPIISLPGFRLLEVNHEQEDFFAIRAEFVGLVECPKCGSQRSWKRARKVRRVRHESFGLRASWLVFEAIKYECLACGRFFYPHLMGIGRYQRSSQRFKSEVVDLHHKGIAQNVLGRDYRIGPATIERWYKKFTAVKLHELKNRSCPRVLGVDEHFFTRKKGYATTFADLTKQKVFDVTLGRSEKSLEGYLKALPGKDRVRVAVIDLSETYRSIIKKHFSNALIVADRFHVVRLINHQFLKTWSTFDPKGRFNRGLLSLMRQHHFRLKPESRANLDRYLDERPILKEIYFFKQRLIRLMLERHHSKRTALPLVHEFLRMIEDLKNTSIEPLKTLGYTLCSWREEIARMWRFTKTNSITEGLHNKMEMLSRRAFGFRTFENYRIRVLVHCGYKF
jgi:transposase